MRLGLIIKKMLLLSENSENETERNLAHNTRGVVFYSCLLYTSDAADE